MAENDSRSSRSLTSRCAKLGLMGRVGPGRLPCSPDLLCFATCRRRLTLLAYRKKSRQDYYSAVKTSSLNFSRCPLLSLSLVPLPLTSSPP